MLAGMTNALIVSGRIKTTTPKAKLLRRHAERMITLGKSGSLSARRRAMAFMRSKSAVTKLFGEVAERYVERNGGYTRVLKIGVRHGDCAPMSLIELVEGKSTPSAKPKPSKKSAAKGKTTSKAKTAAKPKTAKAKGAAKPEEGSKKETKK
jgi:large subunit ribosomal protein L17